VVAVCRVSRWSVDRLQRRAGLLQTMKYAQFKMEKLGHENECV